MSEIDRRNPYRTPGENPSTADDALLRRQALPDDAAGHAGNGSAAPSQPSGEAPPQTVTPQYYYAPQTQAAGQGGVLQRWKARGGVLGGIASAIYALFKIGAPVFALLSKLKFLAFAGKFLLTGGTMLLSMWAYSLRYGWAFGAGLVGLIFIHECGHALAGRMRGHKYGIMVFVPFMGAFVSLKGHGKNLEEDAFIGIMGPVVGTLAAVACALLYVPTHNPFWLSLAEWGCFVNLFNLLPTPPLDGGWIAPLFSPKLLALGMIIAVVVGFQNPLIWLLLVVSIPRIISGWKADPKTQPYYQVTAADRWKYGAAYVGLAAFLALAGVETGSVLHRVHTLVM